MNAETNKIEAADTATPTPKKAGKGRRRALMMLVPGLILVGAGYYWATGGRYVTTDNAYIHQPMIAVSADQSGRVIEVDIDENQIVQAGDVLFRIDPVPYEIALDQAEASLSAARLQVAQLRASHATAAAQLEAAQGILNVQERELERQQQLTDRGVGTAAQLDQATVAERSARNNVNVAQRQLEAAAAALSGNPETETDDMPSVRAALASRDAAQRNLAHTEVVAPSPGTVSQIESLNVGQFLGAGTQAATLVNSSDTWIQANFKETQLDGIEIGQEVEVEIDAYPDLKLHGTVESFNSATGSQFSLIPAQNATGNWVKVVQRLAVRIKLDDAPDGLLRDGMSAHVSVDTGASRLDEML